MSRYKWVHCPAGCQGHPAPPGTLNPTYYTSRFFHVGIMDDGTLYNPHGYPEELVRAAVLAADARKHERRSLAAKKAAATKSERRALKVLIIAKRAAAEQAIGPRSRCYVCGKKLTDRQSIERGIGPECWQDVLNTVTEARQRAKECG
jgi:hypothetical protein